jgi:hypothetical protein
MYSSGNIIRITKPRRMTWAGHVPPMGEQKVLVRKPERKNPLRKPRRRWENNIKMYLSKIECGIIDLIVLAQDMDQWRALEKT